MAFRIGRKFAQHTYPDTPRSAVAAFARNFASGPSEETFITDAPTGGPGNVDACGTPIPWGFIESAAPPGLVVPITPRVTGIVRALATVVVTAQEPVIVRMGLVFSSGGPYAPAPHVVYASLIAGGIVTIPLVLDLAWQVGITTTVALVLLANVNNVAILARLEKLCDGPVATATLDLQELPATG